MSKRNADELYEGIELITIEKKLGRTAITREEAAFVKELADKKRFPRAEYVLARMYLCGYQIEQDKALGMKYLARSSRHASYEIQLKIAYIYHVLCEYKKIRNCMEHALVDLNFFIEK